VNTEDTNKLQEELNNLNTASAESQEKQDVVIEVTGFTLFADVKL
jgi:hypothetical protein